MSDAEILNLARAALTAWDVTSPPRLIKNRENAVFEVTGPQGNRCALRLHRPGYQTDAAIRSELWWSEALVNAGLDVPVPVRTRTGDVIAYIENGAKNGRVASLVTWTDGVVLGDGGVPLNWSEAEQEDIYRALGGLLAQLHEASDGATLPSAFERPTLDIDALIGDDPAWGRFWQNPSLTAPEQDLLHETRAAMGVFLVRHVESGGDFGLIHADALRENVVIDGTTPKLIDFDDGVFGFRLYELGVVMSQNWEETNAADLGAALLAGYGEVRGQSEDAEDAQDSLHAFTVMRCLASCGWVIGRNPDDHPDVRTYAQRALRAARMYLDGGRLF